VGNAWRALDGAGAAGRAVIQGVVDGKLSVNSRAFSAEDECGRHSCYASRVMTLNSADEPGVLAVAIGHELAHATESRGTTAMAIGQNELRAWDQSRPVYDNLQGAYRQQAVGMFAQEFAGLKSTALRATNVRVWACQAEARAGLRSGASCRP
jgi:hypothetical protein